MLSLLFYWLQQKMLQRERQAARLSIVSSKRQQCCGSSVAFQHMSASPTADQIRSYSGNPAVWLVQCLGFYFALMMFFLVYIAHPPPGFLSFAPKMHGKIWMWRAALRKSPFHHHHKSVSICFMAEHQGDTYLICLYLCSFVSRIVYICLLVSDIAAAALILA